MDDATLIERRRQSQMAGYRAIGTAAAGSFWREVRPGVQATVVPGCPDRSLPNSVVYTDAGAVLDAHDELTALYDDAGVRAWTVWVVPGDEGLAAGLQARGHAIDGTPAVMVARMEEVDLAAAGELDLDPAPSWAVFGDLNDRAYGLPPGTFAPILAGMGDPCLHLHIARLGGEAVAGLATIEAGQGDSELAFVATVPEARGRGLGAALIRHALRGARERGCTSTTLEASAMGEPLYARLGYRGLGSMRMLERRSA